jgi:hypothetical protein
MKPTIIDIVSNVVVRDYIQHWWQVALDIVNLNSDGKNRYELRREAEELILNELDKIIRKINPEYRGHRENYTIETLIESIDNAGHWMNWSDIFSEFKEIALSLEDEYTRRLNDLIDKNNAS